MDPLAFSLISCLVLVCFIYIVTRLFRKSSHRKPKTFKDSGSQTETAVTSCDKGTFTYVKQATKKFQVKPQVYNAATETEDIILDTEDLYADLTLFSEILQYNVGTDFKTLKDTYDLAIDNFTKKTNYALQRQQESIEKLEDSLREEVHSHTRFLLECFSQEAYHRFLENRSTADEERKVKSIDEQAFEQFADYAESEDEKLKEIAVRNTRLPGEIFTNKKTLAYQPCAEAGKPWDSLKYK